MKGAFATDLKLGDVLALAPVALELEPQGVRSRCIGRGQVEGWTTPGGARVLVPIPERVQQVVASLYAPPSTNGDGVRQEAARIQVRNGAVLPQLALIAAEQLRWEGLKIEDIGPADRSDYGKTRILVFNDKPQALALLTRLLSVRPENVVYEPDPDRPVDLVVILGHDYDPCR